MLYRIVGSFCFVLFFIVTGSGINAQTRQDRPKIVVGVMVDQMRWDYLYRYQDRYSEGGFKRMLKQGFTCENTHIPYSNTATGPGHTCVYTGSVPAVHGIVGNSWYDRSIKRKMYCVEDTLAQTIGVVDSGSSSSPRNLLVTTIGDELKLSNNFRSKVVGVSIKDRSAVFPGGHLSNGSYWYDNGTGKFITSSYYMDDLPQWVKNFNDRKLADQYLGQTWETLYPMETYVQSTADDKPYESKVINKEKSVFPYDFSKLGKDYGALTKSPFGNKLVFEMAKAAIEGEKLGSGDCTDMIAVSFSSTDRLGHAVGMNAVEVEDMYLRLDLDLADFFRYLDNRYGEKGYLLFITADHGASQAYGFLAENKLPTRISKAAGYVAEVNAMAKRKYGISKVIVNESNQEIYLNWDEIRARKQIDEKQLVKDVIAVLRKHERIVDAWPNRELGYAPWPEILKNKVINGYHPVRGGDIAIVYQPTKFGPSMGAGHGWWYPFDSHIPLVWMGWNIPQGHTNRLIGMNDIAPTLAGLLRIQMPSGSTGQPILELTNRQP
ncbi:MAG: alkaline phosphatase family protein [Chitinophagaceae bacterium]|nr:alkaline phosphatase family protein [Chitinophagaceae bacterium]